MKAIILAGGTGTRLYPSTVAISKQLLTIYDKPMIYYPMSTVMLAGIRDVLIISAPRDIHGFEELFGNGGRLGMSISYTVQEKPRGVADAFIVGENFIGQDSVCLVLGDNIFFGYGFTGRLKKVCSQTDGATVFGYHVSNPKEFGVVELDSGGNVLSFEEKPENPKSSYAVPGLYFYDNKVVDIARSIKPSSRGELEITSVNREYLKAGKLRVELLGRGMTWLDTGTHRSMLAAANFIEAVQTRQGLQIACLEEIAFRNNFITRSMLLEQAERLKSTGYGQYLYRVAETAMGE